MSSPTKSPSSAGVLDAVIAGLLFMPGMRRSEVSALRWADGVDSTTDGDGILVTVRRSKTNQEGEVNDVRFVKDGVARALRTLRAATSPEPDDLIVPLSAQMVGLRFTAAAQAAGIESPVTAHSGRVGLAAELTILVTGRWSKTNQEGEVTTRAVRERTAWRALSGHCGPPRVRSRATASCRCRRRWWDCGSRLRPRPPASRAG